MAPQVRATNGLAAAAVEADLTRGPLRWARGAVVGTSVVALSLGGHLLAGGATPPPGPLVALAALAIIGSIGLSGRRWTFGWLVGLLLGAQVVCHIAFSGLADGHPAFTAAGHVATGSHAAGWAMAAGHLATALLTALVLRHGENACWRLAERLARPLRTAHAVIEVARPVESLSRPFATGGRSSLQPALVVVDAPRRGPPGPSAR